MSLPYATRCAMQALRESSDERAQDAYVLLVQAFVSGDAHDIRAAERALRHVQKVPLRTVARMPAQCQSEEFRSIHNAAVATAHQCGVMLPDTVASEQRSSDVRTSAAYLAVVVVLVLLCVLVHAWVQKCKPSHLCVRR